MYTLLSVQTNMDTESKPVLVSTLHLSDLTTLIPWPINWGDISSHLFPGLPSLHVVMRGSLGMRNSWLFDVNICLRSYVKPCVFGAVTYGRSGLRSRTGGTPHHSFLGGRQTPSVSLQLIWSHPSSNCIFPSTQTDKVIAPKIISVNVSMNWV